ncbi:MAG: hypothetical protein N4A33_12165 [Bacteriovoracaceae bacterium]|nr:hypothetical protein [Bacteriovoracaceae bacterium]
MKKLLIELLALGSISTFASDCTYRIDQKYLKARMDRIGAIRALDLEKGYIYDERSKNVLSREVTKLKKAFPYVIIGGVKEALFLGMRKMREDFNYKIEQENGDISIEVKGRRFYFGSEQEYTELRWPRSEEDSFVEALEKIDACNS